MPWEKKFDEDKVLNEAMKAFWQNGYGGTSMKQLIGCMELNPGSIYAAFGDKKALFFRVMNCYTDQVRERHRELKKQHTPRGLILALFDEMNAAIHAKSRHDGCFMVNTAVGIAPQDKEIQQYTSQWFEELEAFFQQTIKEAQQLGEIRRDLDPGKAARNLIALVCGAQVLARVEIKHAVKEDLMEQVENILK
jgi:TetR/AcrR family transcriptional regulator, transcriptional repressor for nem operon